MLPSTNASAPMTTIPLTEVLALHATITAADLKAAPRVLFDRDANGAYHGGASCGMAFVLMRRTGRSNGWSVYVGEEQQYLTTLPTVAAAKRYAAAMLRKLMDHLASADWEPDCGGSPKCTTHRGGAYNMTTARECRRDF